MSYKEQIGIVIQGPQENESASLRNINIYKNFSSEIIISCWKEDGINNFKDDIKYVETILPDITTIVNRQNIYYQCISTLEGLKKITKPFVIKVRSDEFYTNLEPFIDKVINNSRKVITNNIYFRKFSNMPFHPSDHMIGSATSTMIKTFQYLKTWLETDPTCQKYVPEELIGYSVARCLDFNLDPERFHPKNKEIMEKIFDIVPTDDLGTILWCNGEGAHTSYTGKVRTIKDI